ncbi:MAG: NAD(P)-binding domain-containing protein, partial [Acidobacteriota bacterium]
MRTFSIVGAGRLGTSLAAALSKKGWNLEVIADRDPLAAREGRRIVGRGRATADLSKAGRADVLFVCVPDDSLEAVARKLARSGPDWAGRIVFHTSGLHSSGAL